MMTWSFDPTRYGISIGEILTPRLADLGPGRPDSVWLPRLKALTPGSLGQPIRDSNAAHACLAGLYLYHDFLDESHEISQSLETPEGSFWHAIMHRREPDAWNSKYWWRRVGAHEVLEQLRTHSLALGYRFTTPEAFVDLVELVRDTGSAEEALARKVQRLEWELLFDYGFRKAIGD